MSTDLKGPIGDMTAGQKTILSQTYSDVNNSTKLEIDSREDISNSKIRIKFSDSGFCMRDVPTILLPIEKRWWERAEPIPLVIPIMRVHLVLDIKRVQRILD
jgi:hypothetical protein